MASGPVLPDAIDWRLVRAFVAVMQDGTLSAAARRLGTTQPTVGRQIRTLEAACGEVLFLRRGTRLDPTEAARAIHAQAEDVDAAVRALGHAFGRLAGDAGPRVVRITAPTLICDHLLPRLLPGIAAAADVQLHLVPSDAVQDLHRRAADIALRLVEPRQPDLIARRIGRVAIGLVAAPAYLDRAGVPAAPADLARHRLILPTDDRVVAAVAARAGMDPAALAAPLRSDDLRHRHALVAAGLGIGTGHDWMAAAGLVRVLPAFAVDVRPVWLVATEDIRTSAALRAVHDALGAAVAAALCAG